MYLRLHLRRLKFRISLGDKIRIKFLIVIFEGFPMLPTTNMLLPTWCRVVRQILNIVRDRVKMWFAILFTVDKNVSERVLPHHSNHSKISACLEAKGRQYISTSITLHYGGAKPSSISPPLPSFSDNILVTLTQSL